MKLSEAQKVKTNTLLKKKKRKAANIECFIIKTIETFYIYESKINKL